MSYFQILSFYFVIHPHNDIAYVKNHKHLPSISPIYPPPFPLPLPKSSTNDKKNSVSLIFLWTKYHNIFWNRLLSGLNEHILFGPLMKKRQKQQKLYCTPTVEWFIWNSKNCTFQNRGLPFATSVSKYNNIS